ncbi:MAG TPA: replication factor C large subunit [Candidatus Thermoplasmatota archaeon]|nr:replication factor C large subunit [Candidatus Thermoplasmatota archaeon]
MDWTERHRPASLKDVVGNASSVGKLRAWAESWAQGVPAKRAVTLAGPPGTGKTSTALALARDMGWQAIELNASDARNAATIQRVALAGAVHQTFGADGSFQAAGEGGRKLIILDEADNLYERAGGGDEDGPSLSDRGGKAAIIDTIRQTRQPVVLIVNDLYALEKGSGSALKALTEVLKFTRINVRSIPNALARIAQAEGIQVEREALEAIAVRSEGDLRSAVRDLESLCLGRTHVTLADTRSLGARDTTGSLFDLMRHILKGRRLDDVRKEVWGVDATPDDLVLWVDENLPKEFKDPRDLVAGYEMLSRADIFLGRTRSTQDYALWAYASELGTLGVMASRSREYRDFTPFGFPQWLSRMGRTKGLRQTKDHLAETLGRATHASKRKTRTEQVEAFAAVFRLDREFAVAQTREMDLTDEEVVLLLGPDATGKDVKDIRAAVEAAATPPADTGMPELPKKKAKAKVETFDDGPEPEKPAKPKPAAGQKGLFGF